MAQLPVVRAAKICDASCWFLRIVGLTTKASAMSAIGVVARSELTNLSKNHLSTPR